MEEAAEPDDVAAAVQGRHHPRGDPAAGHRVAGSCGGLVAVGDHLPGAVGSTPEVGGSEDQPALGGGAGADRLVDEPRVAVDHLRGHDPFVQQPLLAVEVGEHPVEQQGPLGEPGLDRGPLAAGMTTGIGSISQRLAARALGAVP